MSSVDRIYSDIDHFYIQSNRSFDRGFTVKPKREVDLFFNG